MKHFWRHLIALDNRTVNTGAVFAGLGALVTLAVIIYDEFIAQCDSGMNNRYLLLGLIGLGGWGYAASLRAGRYQENEPPGQAHERPPTPPGGKA